jgi:hypothetical protein
MDDWSLLPSRNAAREPASDPQSTLIAAKPCHLPDSPARVKRRRPDASQPRPQARRLTRPRSPGTRATNPRGRAPEPLDPGGRYGGRSSGPDRIPGVERQNSTPPLTFPGPSWMTERGRPKHTDRSWGTQAILDAPVRDRGGTLIMELNDPPDHSSGRAIRMVYKKETGEFILNGHPFGSALAMVSVLARKAYLMEQRRGGNAALGQDLQLSGPARSRSAPGRTCRCKCPEVEALTSGPNFRWRYFRPPVSAGDRRAGRTAALYR